MIKMKVCVVTGTRSEYGLLKPLIDKISKDNYFELILIVTGTHLSSEFGMTYEQIEKDGYKIADKIEILLSSDSAISISKTMGLTLISFAECFSRLKPDLIILLGDRFEIFSVASTALISKIPVAHISGGDITAGAFDDALRHAITKLSHIHFTTTEVYRKRVIQMGEDPSTVFNVGNLALDNLKELKLLDKQRLEKELNITFKDKNFLICFHPATLDEDSVTQFDILLKVLKDIDNVMLIFTKSNADTGGRKINELIDSFCFENPLKAKSFFSLGQLRFLSVLKYVDAIIGNSSSGIVEAPSTNTATINIGSRQKGRIKPGSIIECESDYKSIQAAINLVFTEDFKNKLRKVKNPYDGKNTSQKIVNHLKKINLSIKKNFYDIDFSLPSR